MGAKWVELNLVGGKYYRCPIEIELFRTREADEAIELKENGDVFVHVKYYKQECTLVALLGDISCRQWIESHPVLLSRNARDFNIFGSDIYLQMRDGSRKVFKIDDAWARKKLVEAGVVWRNTDSMEEATSL